MGNQLNRRHDGSSLVEMIIALGIASTVLAGVFSAVSAAQRSSSVQAEASDLEQRLRVAAEALTKDLMMAGRGPSFGPARGPLVRSFPAVFPYRMGAVNGDPAGTFRNDAITLFYAAPAGVETETTLAADATPGASALQVRSDPGCGINPACGFAAGDTALVFDTAGHFDAYAVREVSGDLLTVAANHPAGVEASAYPRGSPVISAIERIYFLKPDTAHTQYQLVASDGGARGDVPMADHIVSLRFEYYAKNESVGASPVALSSAQLVDGPWRPDGASVSRFDEDLLRVNTIAVTLRVEAASEAMRGPAGPLFTRGGTARDVRRFLPDREIRLVVSPRNLTLTP